MNTIHSTTSEALQNAGDSIIHFTDVGGKRADFDAELSIQALSSNTIGNHIYYIGDNPLALGQYGLVTLHQLVAKRKLIQKLTNQNVHETILSVVNCAPRSDADTQNGKNGADFYLASTSSGLQAIVTSLGHLSILNELQQITALYRIDIARLLDCLGYSQDEQFRSAIIANVRFFLDCLIPIFEFEKEYSSDPHERIPELPYNARAAYFDQFGNVRVLAKQPLIDRESVQFGDKVNILLGGLVKSTSPLGLAAAFVDRFDPVQPIPAYYVKSLRDIPSGQIGIYQNASDGDLGQSSGPSFLEIVRRSNNPNSERNSAKATLQKYSSSWQTDEISVEKA